MRILLFLGTNLAVIMLLSVVFSLLGIDNLLAANGVDLDLQALLIYSAIIGFSGSLISCARCQPWQFLDQIHSAHNIELPNQP